MGDISGPGGSVATRRIVLQTKFAEKNTVKRMGASWDSVRRYWYVPRGVDVTPFSDWVHPSQAGADDIDHDGLEILEGTTSAPAHLIITASASLFPVQSSHYT